MSFLEAEIYHLLYEDENGKKIGLDEVQLLDPTPTSRIPALCTLLNENDQFLVYQAAIILTAWGIDEGLEKIEELIDKQIHISTELAPHKIDSYDNVYDELAFAVDLYGLYDKNEQDRKRIFCKLLKLYGSCMFESKLKYALLNCPFSELAPEVYDAILRALTIGKLYLASQLLPVFARWQPQKAFELIKSFLDLASQTPDPAANIAESLGFIDTKESKEMLLKLITHLDYAVVNEAQESLDKLSK